MNALKPAEIESITLNDDTDEAEVVVAEDQLSLAIGKKGQNVRLAAKLTGWDIKIVSADAAAQAPLEGAGFEFDPQQPDSPVAEEGADTQDGPIATAFSALTEDQGGDSSPTAESETTAEVPASSSEEAQIESVVDVPDESVGQADETLSDDTDDHDLRG